MNDQQRAAMQMALEALGKAQHQLVYNHVPLHECYGEAITALRGALAQPQGEWIDLTDDEIADVFWDDFSKQREEDYTWDDVARAVIAKFKEKNRG